MDAREPQATAMAPEALARIDWLIAHIRGAYERNQPLPVQARVQEAVHLLSVARTRWGPLGEEHEQKLDELHGLTRWALLLYPTSRIDPRMFEAERRAKRRALPPRGSPQFP